MCIILSLYYYKCTAPLPVSVRISERYHISDANVIFTLEWNSITTTRRRVDRYEITIMPPVLLPSSQLPSPLNLTLQKSTLYDINITSINCFGSASIQRQLGNAFESAHHNPES